MHRYIEGLSVTAWYATANRTTVEARRDGELVTRITIEQARDRTTATTDTGRALTLPHRRYSMATDHPIGGSATAGCGQCLRDALQAAGVLS